MLNNFIYAQTKDLFLEALGAGNVLDEAIVFIEDTKEIWNHGHYFGQDSQRFKELEDDLSDFIEQWNNSPASTISSSDITNWNNKTSNNGTVTGVKINGTTKSPTSGVVDLGYINKQLSTSTSSSMTLLPNIYYRNTSTSLSTLTITLGSVSNSNIINEYFVEFTTRSAGTTVSLPSTIKWADGETPTFEASTTYQISIVNNLGVVTKFK